MKLSAFRAERLLPIACLFSAGVLFASELMTIFDFTPPGGETLRSETGHALHGNAMFVVAVFAVVLVVVAVLAGSKPAALGVAVMGAIALGFFLIRDLPHAGQVGSLNDGAGQFLFDAEAVPQAGFWLEMISAIGLAISGAALATLSAEQLMALRPGDKGSGAGATDKDDAAKKAPAKKKTATKKPSSNGDEGSKTRTGGSTAKKTSKKAPAPKQT